MLGASTGLNCPIYLCSLLTNAHPGLTRGTEIRYSRSFLQQSTVGLFSPQLLEERLHWHFFKQLSVGSHFRFSEIEYTASPYETDECPN